MFPRPQDTDAYIRPRQRLQDSVLVGDEWVATEPTLMSTQYTAGARRARAWCCVLMLCVVSLYVFAVLVWDKAPAVLPPDEDYVRALATSLNEAWLDATPAGVEELQVTGVLSQVMIGAPGECNSPADFVKQMAQPLKDGVDSWSILSSHHPMPFLIGITQWPPDYVSHMCEHDVHYDGSPGLVLDASASIVQDLVQCCYPTDGSTSRVLKSCSSGDDDCVMGCFVPGDARWTSQGGPIDPVISPGPDGQGDVLNEARSWCQGDEGVKQTSSCSWAPADLGTCLSAQKNLTPAAFGALTDAPCGNEQFSDLPQCYAGAATTGPKAVLISQQWSHNELVLDRYNGGVGWPELRQMVLAVLTFNASENLPPRLARELQRPLLLYDIQAAIHKNPRPFVAQPW